MATLPPDIINFPQAEEEICQLWKNLDAFQSCLKQSKNRPRYTFYDGPPFATGLPHYGHILAGTIKDTVTRWAHQSGFHVDRRFGWDCHGLPVEFEIDKALGIKGPEDVARMGIEAYNAECRKIVMRYAGEWEAVITRLGRWIDFKNDYKTMYPTFMESIWWVFKQLYDKGLVYRGFKVMPFSTACNTPLSNFESGQNYKDVTDPAVIISFPLDDEPEVAMIGWTTTPWTLPSNLSLCVNPNLVYVKVRDNTTNKVYIMMEARLSALFKTEDEYIIIEKFKGERLKGRTYEPLFPYFEKLKSRGAFRILTDGYVTEESGTGVVHQAPYFGEDDYRVCLSHGVITKDMDMVCPVDPSGRFTNDVTDFEGMYVKDADKEIIKWLKACGRLVHQGTVKHSYPFCWRSETPLIYKAVPSWFVRIEHMTNLLLKSNEQTYWVPEFVKDKRFANWLRDARDWAISRNRYWGTPIPLWISDDGQEVVCIGSITELKELSGVEINDLHRETVDKITIPSRLGKGELKRVTEVFDCWFESGSMPYAQASGMTSSFYGSGSNRQVHYPFENRKEFEDSFPADFIAEGLDQTRGWFYTLLVVSTCLFGKPPFKNLIVNGLVLASDGQKMSKRKKNYPDPMEVVHKYGADALRLYLINSPVVRAESLRFKEEGVRDVLKDVFLPWYNAYRFLIQNVHRLKVEENQAFTYDEEHVKPSDNYKDKWILSFMQSLIKFVKAEMDAYRLYTVVPRLVKFIDQLTNWYVRMNRKRLKGDTGVSDCRKSLETLFCVLYSMCRVMAPFIPFLTEQMYQNIHHLVSGSSAPSHEGSVHYLQLPTVREELIKEDIEKAVASMQTVIELGRVIRDRKTLPIKYPLKEVVVIHKDASVLNDVRSLEPYILEELNVKQVTVTTDKQKYGVQLRAEPDHKILGARLKTDFKKVITQIKQLGNDELLSFQKCGILTLGGHVLCTDDLRIMYAFDNADPSTPSHYEAHSDNQSQVLVLLDVTPDQSMLDEGVAREIINRIQKLRKKAKLQPIEGITIYHQSTGTLKRVFSEFEEFIYNTVKQPLVIYPVKDDEHVIITEDMEVKGDKLSLTITRRGEPPACVAAASPVCVAVASPVCVAAASPVSVAATTVAAAASTPTPVFAVPCAVAAVAVPVPADPFCTYVNVQLVDGQPRGACQGRHCTVLLENPVGNFLNLEKLTKQVSNVFGYPEETLMLSDQHSKSLNDVHSLHKQTVYARRRSGSIKSPTPANGPRCQFVNLVSRKDSTKFTLLLENPVGDYRADTPHLNWMASQLLKSNVKLHHDQDGRMPLSANDLCSLNGKTLYAST